MSWPGWRATGRPRSRAARSPSTGARRSTDRRAISAERTAYRRRVGRGYGRGMANLTTLPFDYQHAGLDFDGVLVSGEHPNAPSVLVFHGIEGRSDAQVDFCHLLAEVGYKAVAVDLFGRAVTVAGADACAAAMDEVLKDRSALRD